MSRKTLDELLAEDDSGLLDVKPRGAAAGTEGDRVRQAFEEINVFHDRMGHAPGAGAEGRRITIGERALQSRLRAYRENPDIAAMLVEADRHGLFAATIKATPATLEELLDLDDDLLEDPHSDLFVMKHARGPAARPDKVSERVACPDFDHFKPMFDKAAAELSAGIRKSMRFAQEQDIEAGGFFVLNGIMVYVAEVNDPHVRNGKRNARLRLIFDNGTEGQNLLRSLATELYKDPNGRRLSDPNAGPLFNPEPTVEMVAAPTDRVTGRIYIVRSLSARPEIAKLDGQLFKIGFTSGSLEDRIRGAKDDPTFLMAPAHPVREYETVNMSANKLEALTHRFFDQARLDIEIKDRFGKPFHPREWFLLPLAIVEQAIAMMIDGSIVRHRYDHRKCEIVKD